MINCPRDGNQLSEHVGSIGPVWRCNVCSGAFVKALPIDELRLNGKKQPREEWDIRVHCPEHNEKMDFFTVNDITIDICTTCGGVWLDGGEIEALLSPAESRCASPESSHQSLNGGAWSGVDLLSPLIDAALSALLHH